ncbi:MAG: DUF4160 domain-containing protein [Planctomycetes bacterium]|nr:DUF4160 domain-containing protein [Planctomycetota bacterium]
MPKISEFYGVAIYMYHDEHAPPHFHAKHGGASAAFTFDGRVLHGRVHPRVLRLVLEWTRIHLAELELNWSLARKGGQLVQIPPLE